MRYRYTKIGLLTYDNNGILVGTNTQIPETVECFETAEEAMAEFYKEEMSKLLESKNKLSEKLDSVNNKIDILNKEFSIILYTNSELLLW